MNNLFKFKTQVLRSAWLIAVLLYAPAVLAKPIALLVGINEYQNVHALEGAVNDVNALSRVLVERWGVAAQDVHTLINEQATHANILRELAALQTRSAPGDWVLVYFSGHGTSALDTNINLPLPYSSGAFVPVDLPGGKKLNELARANRLEDALIIGRTHLRPVFLALEKDRKVFVISDSCYSGNMARNVEKTGAAHYRYVPITLEKDTMMALSPAPAGRETEDNTFPYHHLVFLSAASDKEPARDIQGSDLMATPTIDGLPHGAFTDALLRVLSGEVAADVDNDGLINYSELHRAVMQFMESRSYGHTPQRLPGMAEDQTHAADDLILGRGMPRGGFTSVKPVTEVTVRLNGSPAELTLAGLPGVKLAGVGEAAMLEVATSTGSSALRAGSGDLIINASIELLTRRIEAEVWWRNLVAQGTPDFQVNIETNPATRGNTFVEGDKFVFNVRSSKRAALLILNINPEGRVSVLYPQTEAQSASHQAGRMLTLPEVEKIEVTPPFGMDQVLVLALPKQPADWQGVTTIVDPVSINHPMIRKLERLLSEQGGKFAWQALSVRTRAK
ncbi:MAG: caspase family protein [Gallionella sp.]|nr:caspase family protein [Gallionella sp.]